jgi:hypothetical protein
MKPSSQPISQEAKQHIEQLRAGGMNWKTIAENVPMAVSTLWKAGLGEPIARPMRLLLESRLRELTAPKQAAL